MKSLYRDCSFEVGRWYAMVKPILGLTMCFGLGTSYMCLSVDRVVGPSSNYTEVRFAERDRSASFSVKIEDGQLCCFREVESSVPKYPAGSAGERVEGWAQLLEKTRSELSERVKLPESFMNCRCSPTFHEGGVIFPTTEKMTVEMFNSPLTGARRRRAAVLAKIRTT